MTIANTAENETTTYIVLYIIGTLKSLERFSADIVESHDDKVQVIKFGATCFNLAFGAVQACYEEERKT